MEEFDWTLPNKINIFCLKCMGLWPEGDSYKLNLYTLYNMIITFVLLYIHNICQIINIFLIDDLSVATNIIFVALSDLIAVFKIHTVVRNMKMLKQLEKEIKLPIFQPKNELQKELVKPGLNLWKNVYMCFCLLAVVTLFLLIFFPILDGSVKDSRLPFLIWYPFDCTKSPFYEIIYVHQSLSVICIGTVNVNLDSLIGGLMTFVGAQCDILCEDLRNLHRAKNIQEGFVTCLQHHRKILKFSEDANKFFDVVILAQFFTSVVSLALTMFELTVVTPFTSEFYSILVYANAITVQIFMYCWFGNEVQLKSNKIPYAAYECDWIEIPLQLKKDLTFFILRTQTPIKFSAIKLFYVSIETFTAILRTAWSYFAVLRNIHSA